MATQRGSMRERRPGVWELRAYDPRASRQVSRSVQGGKRDAQRALAALVAEVDAGRLAATRKQTVAGLLDAWLGHLAVIGRSPTTLRGYRSLVGIISASDLGGMRIDRVDGVALERYYRGLLDAGTSAATVGHRHAVLRAAFAQAVRWRLVSANPCDQAGRPTVEKTRAQPPTEAAVRALLAEADRRYGDPLALAFAILAATGMRRGEVCGLRWGDVEGDVLAVRRSVADLNSEGVVVKGTKTGAHRRIAVPPAIVHRLDQWRDDVEAGGVTVQPATWVLAPLDGPMRPGRLTQAWRRLAGPGGPRLHDLRHAHASELLAAGAAITTVSGRLGHGNPATTMAVYSHMLPAADRSAAEVAGRILPPVVSTDPPPVR